MRKGLPDSVQVNGVTESYAFKKLIASGRNETYERDSLRVNFPASSLYDTLYLEAGRKGDIFQVGKFITPLHESIDIRFSPAQIVPEENKIRTGVYYVKGKSLTYRGGTWTNNQISFKTRELGNFTIATDTIPPLVKLNTKTAQKFTCKISDNLSGIYSFSATLNGQWILMQYDYKQNLIWSDPLDPTQPLKGKLVVEVVDNAGNNTVFETNL